MLIKTVSDLRKAFRTGPYAWPGGYPLYFVMGDGEAMSFKAAKAERRAMLEAIAEADRFPRADWLPVALEINYEDSDLYCAHTNEPIECAYPPDGEAAEAEAAAEDAEVYSAD